MRYSLGTYIPLASRVRGKRVQTDPNQIISEIERIAQELYYHVYRRDSEESVVLYCELAPNSPILLRFTLVKKDKQILVNGTVRAIGLAGDKSDIHDVLSTLWAVYLRLNFGISVILQSVVMEDILPCEIYSRNVFFEQPLLHTSPFDVKQGRHILEATRSVSMNIQYFMMQVVNDPNYWGEHQEIASNSEQQRILAALESCGISNISLSAYRRITLTGTTIVLLKMIFLS